MKKILLNTRFLHYSQVIVILLMSIYIYFSSISIDQYIEISKTMDSDYAVIDNTSVSLKYCLDKETKAYQNAQTLYFQESANQVIEITSYHTGGINRLVQDFENYSKKFPIFLQKTSIPSQLFFTEKILSKYEQSLVNYSDSFCLKIELSDRLFFQNTLAQYFKSKNKKLNELPASMAILELKKDKSQLKRMEISFLDYVLSKTAGNIKFDDFMVAINPNNVGIIKVNDIFSVDLAAAAYTTNFNGREFTFSVNGEVLEAKNGLAHFETQCFSVGKQTIHAVISTKHPLTGEVKSASRNYTFEVLPK